MTEPAPGAPAPITPRHYQAVCGLALTAIVLIQMQHSNLDATIKLIVLGLILVVGTLGILDRARVSPVLVLLAIAAPHLIEQNYANRGLLPEFRTTRFLDGADVLVCMAALTYFIGHYRLLGLWSGVLPADRRSPPPARSQESLTPVELLSLVFTVPIFALLAQFACHVLNQPWTLLDLDPAWQQFLVFGWMLLLTMFLAAHAFRYWRRLQMDRMSALLLLQDMVWHETRGEQRRIQRWLAWKKLRERKK